MAERIKVGNLRVGMKTEHYTVLGNAKVDDETDETRVPVRYHDGGDAHRVWDHPNIEIEVLNEGT